MTLRIIYLLTFLILGAASAADLQWRRPTLHELERLYNLATKSLPERMHLDSEFDIQEPPLPQNELEKRIKQTIDEELEFELRAAKAVNRPPRRINQQELKKAIRADLSLRYSGERTLRRREWHSRSGKLLRIDQLDMALLVTDSILRTDISSKRIDTLFTDIWIDDSDFLLQEKYPKAKGFRINHAISSASVFVKSAFQPEPPKLWHAFSIEPEMAFPIVSLLMEADSTPISSPFPDHMAGVRRNNQNIRNAVEGDVAGWSFQARDENIDDQPSSLIRISGHSSSFFTKILKKMAEKNAPRNVKQQLHDASSAVYSYWISQGTTPSRLFRAEKAIPRGIRKTSIRQSFNHHEFPTVWTTELYAPNNRLIESKRVIFKTAELNPNFDEMEVFGPGLIQNFEIVSVDGVRVQSKYEGTVVNLDQSNSERYIKQWTIRFLFFFFLILPLLYFRKSYFTKHQQ